MAHTTIMDSTAAYEQWLHAQLGDDIVKADLIAKHQKMADDVFPFLRATYWRWAETILDVCPELADAPSVLAVGDIHLENYGTWRDVEGRLIWGVNDFDEAAEMPYALDLLRLGVSAVLGCGGAGAGEAMCADILAGYAKGLVDPHPVVLDRDHAWLRDLVNVPVAARKKFWDKIESLPTNGTVAPKPYAKALRAALPDPKIEIGFSRRVAGAGSLGRPRFVGIGSWRGGAVVREAKALVPSAWTLAHKGGSNALRCYEIATGCFRAPDPWYRVADNIAVRRLSPNNRKLEAGAQPADLASSKMLQAMGYELAAIHRGTADRHAAIAKDLHARQRRWLIGAIEAAADFVRSDYKEWTKRWRKGQ
jgi:hypothetical protein